MPHQPRRRPSTAGRSPESSTWQATPHPASPPPAAAAPKPPPGRRLHGEKLDMASFDKDPKDLARILFGKEPVIDEHTSELVFPGPAGAAGPTAHR